MVIQRSKYPLVPLEACYSSLLGERNPGGYGLGIIGRMEGYRTGTYLPAYNTLPSSFPPRHTTPTT
jgi:hypothetical protein